MTLNLSPVAPVTLAAVLLAQGSPSPRQLFALARPLEPSEIAIVLKSVQVALDGKTFRLPGNGSDSGTRVRMRAGGQARIIQMTYAVWHGVVDGVVSGAKTPPPSSSVWREEITTILDYPGLPAQRCNGTVEQGDMVIEYTSRGTGEWTVMARAENLLDSNITGAFSMLRSDEHLSSAERRQIDGKWARAIVSPWAESLNKSARAGKPALLIGDPLPNVVGEPFRGSANEATQSLWIDRETLLPLRWEVTKRDPTRVLMAATFNYESFELGPPAGLEAPRCIR